MNGLPFLSSSARESLARARTAASRASAATIAPEHVLFGLMLEPSGDVRVALARAGADPVAVAALPSQLARPFAAVAPGAGAGLAYSSSVKVAIVAADTEARLDGTDETAPRHLLRALLRDPASPVVRTLGDIGVTLAALRSVGLDDAVQ